jgi:hypothetical protein
VAAWKKKKTKTPSRQELSEWVIQSLKLIGSTILCNSWRCNGFSFFPGEDSIGSDDGHGSNDGGHAENHPDDDCDSDEDSIIFATDYVFGNNRCVAISAEITTENAEEKVDDDSMDDEN